MSAASTDVHRTVELLLVRPVLPADTTEPPADRAAQAAVLSPDALCDVTPRAITLTARQACVVMTEDDAALLVLAVAAAVHFSVSGSATLRDEELTRVRRIATLLHRNLARSLRAIVRERATLLRAAPTAGHADAAA